MGSKRPTERTLARGSDERHTATEKDARHTTTDRLRKPPRRRDNAGHLDPAYAATLREVSEQTRDDSEQDAHAFVDPEHPRTNEPVAELLGETFVSEATGVEHEDELEERVPEEDGGPFVETTGGTEFALGTDASNTPDATREPFPKT